MRIAVRLLLGLGMALNCAGRAVADDAVAIIDRAVRAIAGSPERLKKLDYCIHTARGTMYMPNGVMPAVRICQQHLPSQVKWAGEFGPIGQKTPFVIALDGLRGWMLVQGGKQDLPQGQYEALQDEAYFYWVASLAPLRDKAFAMTELKEALVGDQPARGVKVANRGRSDIQLWFDKAAGLPIKGTFKVREAGLEVSRECLWSAFKDFDGLKLPTRQVVYQRGRKIEEWTIESYQLPDKIDPSVFTKP